MAESYLFGRLLKIALLESRLWSIIFWGICFLFSFVHVFLIIMDGWSRYQDYKKIKDQFYIYGFHTRIAAHFRGSKCQRTAVIVAATELGFGKKAKSFYQKIGIDNYHFIPEFAVKDPIFILKRHFWSRTFLEKHYEPKFNYRKISRSRMEHT
ncbi:hypothetical protein [Autumnicola psychrophila]|uniref:Uncharacterized protein n=1 Tax=Autumnicola psychrophila TaxID=3075592 RepID=A0ABU3DR57_9FLAO|nr:hypothetical protein [Zunongwangia sp. F225]MDT0686190.1 hypothetical protein [Zunongwangia sp. F225]